MFRRSVVFIILITIIVLSQFFQGCKNEMPTNPTEYVYDTTLITSLDTVIVIDSIYIIDTVIIVDTVETTIALEGEWLKFSAYEASKAFVKENYPERADDRFSRMGIYCDYGSNPAGRAGFNFVDNGDSTYTTSGYVFEYLFGAVGFVWGAAQGQPTENTYNYSCTLQLGENNTWTLLNVNLQASGAYIRDTRHD